MYLRYKTSIFKFLNIHRELYAIVSSTELLNMCFTRVRIGEGPSRATSSTSGAVRVVAGIHEKQPDSDVVTRL